MGLRGFTVARAPLFGCAGQLDTVELELGRGARHCQFAEAGEDFADAARVVVEGGPLFSERIEARVIVLDDDLGPAVLAALKDA